jgi:hypothetical protein
MYRHNRDAGTDYYGILDYIENLGNFIIPQEVDILRKLSERCKMEVNKIFDTAGKLDSYRLV